MPVVVKFWKTEVDPKTANADGLCKLSQLVPSYNTVKDPKENSKRARAVHSIRSTIITT